MSELFIFPEGELPPSVLLDKAQEEELNSVVIVGYNREHKLCIWESFGDLAEANYMLDIAKTKFMEVTMKVIEENVNE